MMPCEDFGGHGPPVYFAHANGYPPACYRPLFHHLQNAFRIFALHQRPLWAGTQPNDLQDWSPLADDLNEFFAAQNGPVACVGHSMGGVSTLRAALRRPEQYQAIVLLDPVLIPPELCLLWEVIYRLGLAYRLSPLVRRALRRRRTFNSHAEMFAAYRHKAVFRYFSDESLQALVEGLTRTGADGRLELVYPPEWEARIYVTAPRRNLELWRDLPGLKVPAMILRGAETDTFWERTARLVRQRAPQVHIVTLSECTHLLSMEKPQEVARLIIDFIKATV